MLDPRQIRQQLHLIPELAFAENATKAFLKAELEAMLKQDKERSLHFELHEFTNSSGLLLSYSGTQGDYQLFRADMDALPLVEQTGYEYASRLKGCMHACGHDVHMAVLMGLIARVYENLPQNNILFLFQPAEEGKGGAQSILAEGVIQQYPVSAAFALHVGSNLPVGTISSKTGIFFGIPQEFDVEFIGKAAHVAFPEQGVNALSAAIDFMSQMQNEVLELSQSQRLIFHVGKMQAGRIRNVIADSCILEGTHRSLNIQTRNSLNELIEKRAIQCARSIGARVKTDFLGSYDAVVNDQNLYERLKERSTGLGYRFLEANTVMTGEDFGFFTTIYPGLLFWLGSGSEHSLHSPEFLPDESCIQVGIDVMYALL
ncbi:MAG: amidohydrolase [Candidatus Cloacimonetes bacterium]|jgi:N-acetyldiaminopimelate deacetylase|nr:amidohydrolase [Candidatus Cloacimonadota bacterium]MDY0337166.1 amidohydrolase [Candidatus Cloacimonadaceae bacterium]MCB5269626.1 amidohydrolase [Candidatus Cloacimonadota bacterium]MCK9333686.1 amidohydrolase [Candidatus Cloacimonadota bacterium]MDD2543554.1 amidohydrolase [Candidatus Cloacimonadota bacterium]